MSRVYFTVGLPRSGKSTVADRWASLRSGRVVVAADDVRLALHGSAWYGPAEPMVHAIVKTTVRALLGRGFDVMVDETNVRLSQRAAWREIDPAAISIAVNTSPAVCRERAIATGQDYLLPVIDRMAQDWEEDE